MNLKIISGGQSGADQAALRAAKAAGLPTGGFAPKGWLTEDGPAPWLKEFGLVETADTSYPSRTRRNVCELAHACLWFGNPYSPGGKLTLRLCEEVAIPHYVANTVSTPRDVADWLKGWVLPICPEPVLLVAGNRESGNPGIGERVERFLGAVFGLLASDGK
jgi:predicted deacetylase